MKTLLSAILITTSMGAYANMHGDWDKLPFDQAKKMKLEKLDKKISLSTKTRQCVNAATDKAALKACYNEMKADKQALKAEMKDKIKQSQEEAVED